jgi:hypothetical protein
LMGWDSEQVIRDCIDRLHSLDVNRIRVLLDGRTDHFWTEPIKPGNGFRAYLNPWIASRPDDVRDPRFDYTRFNCPYWQKFERMLETAKRGTGVPPDTGGGWVNGRSDDTMIMLKGYAHMVHFFTSFEWWKSEPHDELVNNGAFCLADPGKVYAVYLPHGGGLSVKLEPERYGVKWFNPRDGEYSTAGIAEGATWTSPEAPDNKDWVLLLTRTQADR